MSEHYHQCALIEWAGLEGHKEPRLWLLFAIPNGGARHPVVAAKMKAEGVKKGVPDLMLPVAARGFHGLFIEMKDEDGGRMSRAQKEWQVNLMAEGYLHVVCHGWDSARESLLWYLGHSEKNFGAPDANRA